jgi:Domain of unknown function (DUF6379)
MFADQLIEDDSLENDDDGFSFLARLNWYRALPLSSIRLTLDVDGERVDDDAITFAVDGESYRSDELRTRDDRMWFVVDSARVHVARPGGLRPGRHDLTLSIASRIPYLPTRPPDVLVQEDTCHKTVEA